MAEEQEVPTCGKGLAENSVLPRTLAELMAAMADLFDAHRHALDGKHPAARPELEAYESLASGYRKGAHQLEALDKEMSGYRELPMPKHDPAAMMRQEEAYETVLAARHRLRAILAEPR